MSVPEPEGSRGNWLRLLALLTAVCVLIGVCARLWGLGKWPLAIDEYYFARSVQNILRSGLPQYPCGGFYVRGLLLQYATALLQLAGLSPELAPRLIAAVCSLITLPAAMLLGRRAGGRAIGLLTVLVLALSVWEVEIGRFGRMYAPFQALFCWYMVFFMAYAVDRNRRALAPLLVLSGLGVFVWEGGVFLVMANLMLPFILNPTGRLRRADWIYLGAACLLFLPVYPFAMADLLPLGAQPLLPADYQPPPDAVSPSRLDAAVMPLMTLRSHPLWCLLALLPLAVTVYALAQRLRSSAPPANKLAWLAVLGFAALQQFELAAGLTLILLLLRIVSWSDVGSASGRALQAALLCWLAFWIAFGLSTPDWHTPGLSPLRTVLLLGYEFVRFPDLMREVAAPWVRTVPLLSLGLFILLSAACIRACVKVDTPQHERILLAMFVTFLLLVGTIHPPHQETRYVFFLYPLAVIIALLTIEQAMTALLGATSVGGVAAAAVALAAFGLSEDFRPAHLWNINTEAVNFRLGMSSYLSSHYHPRSDVRSAAQWLAQHAVPGQDIVIDSYPGVDFYGAGNFYFMPESDPRFEVYSCRQGTIQRWSNLPLIHSYTILQAKVATGRKVWMVLEAGRMADVVAHFPPTDWTLAWISKARDIAIVQIQAHTTAPG